MWTQSDPGMDLFTRSGPRLGPIWTPCGPGLDPVCTSCGPGLDLFTKSWSGPGLDPVWTPCGPGLDLLYVFVVDVRSCDLVPNVLT